MGPAGVGGVGHVGVGGSCRGGVLCRVGWVMQGWDGSYRGGVGWVMVGWGGSSRGGVDHGWVGWVM